MKTKKILTGLVGVTVIFMLLVLALWVRTPRPKYFTYSDFLLLQIAVIAKAFPSTNSDSYIICSIQVEETRENHQGFVININGKPFEIVREPLISYIGLHELL